MFESYYRNIIFKFLDNIEKGTIILNDVISKTFGSGNPKVTIEIVSPRFYRRTVLGGDLGFAESYAKSEWFADNLTDLIKSVELSETQGKFSETYTGFINNVPVLIAKAFWSLSTPITNLLWELGLPNLIW